jgi:phenylpropionate dioxygenase-like ring-hydroxylating dioxygenase large terminal subunit
LFKERTRYGLIERQCAHRGADLAYGRLEDGGLRCSFHGWLFDVDGKCLQTPAEPPGSRLCEQAEIARFNLEVSDWEHREYFDLF